MKEKFGGFEYELLSIGNYGRSWHYVIYTDNLDKFVETEDIFCTQQEARFAAIGHITLLENGESNA